MENVTNSELITLREKLRKQGLETSLSTLGIRLETEDNIVDIVNKKIQNSLGTDRVGAVVEGIRYVIPFVGNLQQIALILIVEQYKPYRKM